MNERQTEQPVVGGEPRKERCETCGNLTAEWFDTDWSCGRICPACYTRNQPESERAAAAADAAARIAETLSESARKPPQT